MTSRPKHATSTCCVRAVTAPTLCLPCVRTFFSLAPEQTLSLPRSLPLPHNLAETHAQLLGGCHLELGPVTSRVEILGPSGSVVGTQVGGIAF